MNPHEPQNCEADKQSFGTEGELPFVQKFAYLDVETNELVSEDGTRRARTTLDAIRASKADLAGVTSNVNYTSFGGITYTPLHDEHYGLGSSLEMVYAKKIGAGLNAPESCKVWIFLEDADQNHGEYTACLGERESLHLKPSNQSRERRP